jgi:hypothetical protein
MKAKKAAVKKVGSGEAVVSGLVNKDCPSRQAVCRVIKRTAIENRLQACKVGGVLNANNFTAGSQAQLIDLIVRASSEALSVNEIAKRVLHHKDCSVVFGKADLDFVTVLKRVRRHCMVYDNMQARIIKRNSYTL